MIFLLRIAFLLLPLSIASAQIALTGTVVDSSGAPLAGVVVSLNRPGVAQVTTNGEGQFSFPALPPGTYEVKIVQESFQPKTVSTRVSANTRPAPLRISLDLAEVRDQVTITDQISGVSTAPSDNMNAVKIGSDELRGLPVLGNDLITVLEEFTGGAGGDPGGSTVIVDGVEMDARSIPAEAIQHVQINRDPYTAEFARPGRGRIEITTRDATSSFHGSARMGFRDSALDARNAFASKRPDEQRRMFAGYLTGPLDRSGRTSFMVAAEQETSNLQALIYAQTPGGLLNQQIATPETESDIMVKLRRLVGDKQIFTFQFGWERSTAGNQGVGGFQLPEVGYSETGQEYSWRLQHTAFPTPTLISDLTVEWETGRDTTQSLFPGIRRISVNDAFVAGGAQADQIASEKELGIKYAISWTGGKHLIRTGFELPDWNWQGFDDLGNRQGTFQFSNLAAFAAGQPFAFVQQVGNGSIRFRQRSAGFFFQDTFNIQPNLTLGLGVRYDRQNYVADKNNLAPRVSLAFSPGKERRDVFRAGFGIFYDRFQSGDLQDLLLLNGSGLRRLLISQPNYPDPFLDGAAGTFAPASIVQRGSNFRSPNLIRYSFAWERRLFAKTTLSITYAGLRGVSLFRSVDANAPAAPDFVRPNPAFATIRQLESSAAMKSQSLEVSLNGRFTNFFNGTLRYELGRITSNADSSSSLPANTYNLESEWSRSNRDRRHVIRAIGNIDGGKWFQTGFVLSAGSGTPYSTITGRDDNRDGNANDRPLGLSRNTNQGPGRLQLDVRWSREFQLTKREEGPKLMATADAFNAINRVNYSGYVGNLSSPFFGLPVSSGPARRLQLGLRFTF